MCLPGGNTYEFYLDTVKLDATIEVELEDILAEVAINNNIFEAEKLSKVVEINGKVTKVTIYVKAQDGTIKTYTLNIYALSDNTNIKTIKVDEEAILLTPGTNEYIAKVSKTTNVAEVEIIAEDAKSKITIVGALR